MKKILSLISFLILRFSLIAQDVPVPADSTYTGPEEWSMDTKITMMTVFAIISIIVVLRTFRNKPDV